MITCTSCGFDNAAASKFCGSCGQRLQDRVSRERRQLTVMFCDLVGSTALAERLDPEELSDLVHAYHRAAEASIASFDGHVAQHLGDGLLVYFGYPVAHEDDALRAAYAGLAILDGMAALNNRLDPTRQLAVRIGIHTGPVVTGEIGSGATQERLALGSTPNVAARLQTIAEPNTVVVSGDTRALLKHACVCEQLPAAELKGLSQSITAHRVLSRVHTATFAPSTEMVGREHELGQLQSAFAAARDGGSTSTAVLVTGEAGIGKSRLIHAFRDGLASVTAECWVAQCSPYEQASALRPVIGLLQNLLQLQTGTTPAERFDALVAALERLGLGEPATVTVLATLLGIPLRAPYAPVDITPQGRKALTLEAIASIILKRAAVQPVVCLVEDLHWADPSTLEFFSLLMSRAGSAPLNLVMTARSTFKMPWQDGVTVIALEPLDRARAIAIISRVTKGQELPARLIDQIIDKTDGVPLFVEELTKTILESGALTETAGGYVARDLTAVPIPTSLQASLTARLDRLGTVKQIAQLASVIGREFDYEMLRAVSSWSDEVLQQGLQHLTAAELVSRQGTPPAARYSFTHSLTRDAAYEMLLKSARRDHHRSIGTTLLERFAEVVELRPELAAHHFTEAGALDLAIPQWMKAGKKAAGESANVEAISHLDRALSLIAQLPASPERDGLELGTLLTLGPPLVLSKGYVVEEVERTYLRAQELNERGGDLRQRFWIDQGINQFRMIRGEMALAMQLGDRLLTLAESLNDPLCVARAECIKGVNTCYNGEFAASAEWMDRALSKLPTPDLEFVAVTGMDLGALCHMYAAWAHWHLGATDRAQSHVASAMASAEASGLTHARGHALVWAGMAVSHFLGDVDGVRQYSREATAISVRYGFPVWALQAALWSAWADAVSGTGAATGATDTSLSLLRMYQSQGANLTLTYFMALVAETHWHCGDITGAEALIDEALAHDQRLPDPMWSAEVNRLKGEIVLKRAADANAATTARDYFTRALEIARQQGSVALAERAAASLARVSATATGR